MREEVRSLVLYLPTFAKCLEAFVLAATELGEEAEKRVADQVLPDVSPKVDDVGSHYDIVHEVIAILVSCRRGRREGREGVSSDDHKTRMF